MPSSRHEILFDLSAEDVKRIREKTGMTQKEFSNTFGINLSTLRHWERGDRAPHGPAVVLLNIIEKSPVEVFSILDTTKGRKMKNSKEKDVLKKIVIEGKHDSFKDLVNSGVEGFEDIVLALISANGFPYTKMDAKNGESIFYAGHDPNHLNKILSYKPESSQLKGDFEGILEKTYLVIFAIEHELSDAMYLPHEMRQKRIAEVINRIGIGENFYSNILKNW